MNVRFEVTLKELRKEGACFCGYNKVVRSLQGKPFSSEDGERESYIRFAHKDQISLLSILESNDLDDALWALRCVPGGDRDARLFAVWCARQVQHLMGDARSINALDVAERFADGAATDEELAASRDAAQVAAQAAQAAAQAARDASWDASRDASRDAAWAARDASWDASRAAAWAAQAAQVAAQAAQAAAQAARDASWDASRDAAWAARDASRDASRAAAWAAQASRAAAWAASRAAQKEMFILMCNGKAPWQKGAA